MRQGIKYVVGVVLAAGLLWLVMRGTDPAAIGAALTNASMLGLVLAGALNLGHNVFRVMRWGSLLRPVRPRISFRSRFSAVIVGYLTTWVIPGRLGEIVRPALLARREKISFGPCVGSVVADRLLDGVAVLALFAVGTFFSPVDGARGERGAAIRTTAIALVLIVSLALGALLLAGAARAKLSLWLQDRSSSVFRWLGHSLLSLAEGTDALRSPRLLGPIVVQSLLAWGAISLGTWIGVRASGADVGFSAILVLLPFLALGVALPTPGGAGGYHAAMTFGLMHLFHVPEGVAVGAGLLMHLAVTLPVIALGLVFLWLDRISWSDLKGMTHELGSLGAGPTPKERPAEAVR